MKVSQAARELGVSKLSPSKRTAITGALSYIEELGRLNGVKTKDWELFKVFGKNGETTSPHPANLITTREDLKAAFFKEHGKQLDNKQATKLPPDLELRLKKNTVQFYDRRLNDLESKISYERGSIDDYNRKINIKMNAMHSYWLELQSLKGKRDTTADHVVKVIDSGLYDYLSDNIEEGGSLITFVTAHDVVLKHQTPALGKFDVNLGRFRVDVDVKGLLTYVRPYRNNLHVAARLRGGKLWDSGYYHPHVDGGGEICWGNGGTARTREASNGNLLGIMELLHILMTNYNSRSPYQSLEHFRDKDLEGTRWDWLSPEEVKHDHVKCRDCGFMYPESEYEDRIYRANEEGIRLLDSCHECNLSPQNVYKAKMGPCYVEAKKEQEEEATTPDTQEPTQAGGDTNE